MKTRNETYYQCLYEFAASCLTRPTLPCFLPSDLRQGWESIRMAQEDDFERDEHLFGTGEVRETEAG